MKMSHMMKQNKAFALTCHAVNKINMKADVQCKQLAQMYGYNYTLSSL